MAAGINNRLLKNINKKKKKKKKEKKIKNGLKKCE